MNEVSVVGGQTIKGECRTGVRLSAGLGATEFPCASSRLAEDYLDYHNPLKYII